MKNLNENNVMWSSFLKQNRGQLQKEPRMGIKNKSGLLAIPWKKISVYDLLDKYENM